MQKCSATLDTLFRYICDICYKLCWFWTEHSISTFAGFAPGRDQGIAHIIMGVVWAEFTAIGLIGPPVYVHVLAQVYVEYLLGACNVQSVNLAHHVG